ncbi:ankyrin repeat domain-containing protein [Humidesulfovibrio idahonensis]
MVMNVLPIANPVSTCRQGTDQPAALRLRGRVALLSGIDIFAVSIARGYRLGYHHRHCYSSAEKIKFVPLAAGAACSPEFRKPWTLHGLCPATEAPRHHEKDPPMRQLLPVFALLLAALLVSACTFYSSDPDIARLERAAEQAPKGPTPAIYMSPAEMYPDNAQAQALVKAASKGDIKEIDRLIDAGADPNAVGTYGMTVPGWVLYHPNKAGFRRLLERGADPNKIWYDKDRAQSSLLHLAVALTEKLGTDYLKMCLEIGKGNPNLEPPDHRERPIVVGVRNYSPQAFWVLYNAGAELDYKIRDPYSTDSLADKASVFCHYDILLFMLHKGVHYTSLRGHGIDMHTSIQSDIDRGFAGDKTDTQYMWFWRCVKFLEERGMTFHYGIYSPPAVLDTTPPESLNTAAGQAAALPKNINMLMQQVDLTYPLPVWADTPETHENVQIRQQQKAGTIILDYLPQNQTESDWKSVYTVMTTYTPGTSLDQAARMALETMRKGLGKNATIVTEESTQDHQILHFASADASGPEGVVYIGRFLDTIVTVRETWRSIDATTANAYRAKALAGMRQVVMKKGLTVLPMN